MTTKQNKQYPRPETTEQEPLEVYVCATEVLYKPHKITTSGYTTTPDLFGGFNYDYTGCNLEQDFKDCGNLTIESLLAKTPKYLNLLLEKAKDLGLKEEEKEEIHLLLKTCKGWRQAEFEVVLD